MKKLLIMILAVGFALPALAEQEEITAISTITANREALRTALNLRLASVQSNFDEIYTKINAGPLYVNASAPADTSVLWIDSDQDNALKAYIGGVWTVVGSLGGEYTLPAATDTTLGGVKVGARLSVADGVLSADVQTTDISGKQDTLISGTNIKTINSTSLLGSGDITISGSGDDLGSATYSDVVGLWTTCTGYLKSDGTCDTPSGSATYPSAAGVANWSGSAWGTSYTVGTAASNLVQLNASAQLPAVSADLLTITDTGTYFTADTVGAALQELGSDLAAVTEITIGTGLNDTNGTLSVTYPVTAEAWSGSGWNADTDGLARNDAYDYLHIADTDDDGLPNKVDLSSAGIVKADANGVVAVATAGTDYLTTTNLATGSTDNAILRANGTGGSTAQASGVTIDDNDNVTVPGVIKGRTLFNSYAADQTLTAATHNSTVVQMTVAGEVTMWDCETANVGDQVILWARDAEKIEVVPASGDHFALFNGTALTADYELDVPATAGTKVTLLCTADDTWSVFHETATTTDGGAAD